METKSNIVSTEIKPSPAETSVQGTSFNTLAFNQEVQKRKVGRPSQKDKQKLVEKGWTFDNKEKSEDPESPPPLTPEEDKRLRELALAPNNIKCVGAVYRKGLMVSIMTEFKWAKIPMNLLPEQPCTKEDAESWAYNFINILISKVGVERTGSILIWVTLLGQPLISITEAHNNAKSKMTIGMVQQEIDSRK